MTKIDLPARLRFDFPTGIVVVSCSAGKDDEPSLIAVGAVSHACIDPPMLGVAIGHARYTFKVISRSDGFVVNVPSKDQAEVIDFCGSVSGREVNKFRALDLTPLPSTKISSPGIQEFPINMECAVRKSVDLGSHSFFFGEIVAVHCDESVVDSEGGIDKNRLKPLCAFLDSYWGIGEPMLRFHSTRDMLRRYHRLEHHDLERRQQES